MSYHQMVVVVSVVLHFYYQCYLVLLMVINFKLYYTIIYMPI